ncbi:TRAM_LAG1_CLN8 domain-containing protein, partial [Cephalotus follicularis]
MEDCIVKLVLLGVIAWTSAFLLIRSILPKRSFDFCSRLVATIHAILALILSSLSIEDWRSPVCHAPKSSSRQMKTLAVSLSYFIYDLICCQFDKRVYLDKSIHHVFSILGIAAGLITQKSGSESIATLWITQMSHPFLHTRELLKELGYRDTKLYLTADIVFSLVFSVARMVVLPHIIYVTCSASNPLALKVTGVALQLVSAFWFYKIARSVKYKLIKWMTS